MKKNNLLLVILLILLPILIFKTAGAFIQKIPAEDFEGWSIKRNNKQSVSGSALCKGKTKVAQYDLGASIPTFEENRQYYYYCRYNPAD